MHFDVQIVDSDTSRLNQFILESKLKFNSLSFSIEENLEKILEKLNLIDILIIDTTHQYFDFIMNEYESFDKYVILLGTCKNIEKYNLNKYEVLSNSTNLDELLNKIEYYTDLLNKDLLLKKEQELSNSIINGITNPIFLTDGNKIIFANDFFFKLTGLFSLKEINARYEKITDLFEDEIGFISKNDKNWLENLKNNSAKACILNSQNQKKYFTIQQLYLKYNNTNIIILHDISHEIIHKQELYNLLYTDNLTKLPNRASLIEQLQHKTITLEALAIIDINSFKEINDFFGHKIGDYILNEIAKLINEQLGNRDYLKLYKFPSDTYCITNTKNDQNEFIDLIIKITETIYKKVFVIDPHEIDTRITTGISFSNKNNKLITADIALQSAKKDHKDYLVFYDELDKFQEYENNMLWTKKLKNAFVHDKIEVYYQPLINNQTLKVEKYECLVRLIDEDGKVVSPYFFLDISKKSNQYTKITKIVLEKSFKKFDKLPFEFSVNISYEDIEDPEFLDFIKENLNKYNVSNKVVFEILEDENVKNYELLVHFIDEVKALGCKVAIDDFGSGYSNFEHLLKMKVDYLKIDASLIKNVATDNNSYKITKTIIDFAKSLNLKTIAEFVENQEIFEIVKNLGADFSQGYYFSAPIVEPKELNFEVTSNE